MWGKFPPQKWRNMTESINPQDTPDVVIVHSPDYENWVFSSSHPTQGRRFINGYNQVLAALSHAEVETMAPRQATREELALVHTQEYISEVLDQHSCEEWDGKRPDLSTLASTFVGGTLTALDCLLDGEVALAVHLPGAKHHAQADTSSGFCVFADFAIAAKIAVARGYKVAIFDYDAHHGDGTENLCADDPNILTYSVHEQGIFPGTGNSSDPDRHVYNRPLDVSELNAEFEDGQFNFRHDEALVEAALEFARVATEFGAEIIFIAAGADGHYEDPLSNLQYHSGFLIKVFGGIFYRDELAKLPVLIGGAGGYRPDDATPQMWAEAVSRVVESRSSAPTAAMQARQAGGNA
jgi:acetoin utilization protein AcuC